MLVFRFCLWGNSNADGQQPNLVAFSSMETEQKRQILQGGKKKTFPSFWDIIKDWAVILIWSNCLSPLTGFPAVWCFHSYHVMCMRDSGASWLICFGNRRAAFDEKTTLQQKQLPRVYSTLLSSLSVRNRLLLPLQLFGHAHPYSVHQEEYGKLFPGEKRLWLSRGRL